MKLSVWAKKQGITYHTAYKWFREGKIPHLVEVSPSGSIFVHEDKKEEMGKIVIYARVSSYDRKKSLENQISSCVSFANSKGFEIEKIYKEIASGMNDKRPKLMEMLDSLPSVIIVEHKDRLTRFGFNYLEKLLNKLNCQIIVLNRDCEDEKDLIKDMISIITSFCCRLYGIRRGRKKVKEVKDIVLEQ